MGKDQDKKKKSGGSIDSIFRGLGDLVEKLGELAEKGEQLRRSGEFTSGEKKEIKGVYGFNVKVGLGDDGVRVEPFGNVGKKEEFGESSVCEIREPLVDIFEEDDHTLIVAEMPGVGADDISFALAGDILAISGKKGDKRYGKEIKLSKEYSKEQMQHSCNNGILRVKLSN